MAFPILSDSTYRIESELGAGGGGVVYKAWHSRLQKHVVLKRIKDDSGLLKQGRARDETDILKNLKHANLPQLYDFLDDPSGIYTVMEFIPGQSFAELLKAGERFAQPQLVRWAEQLADALQYLHGRTPPVLHSDIKPGNIMLTPNGDVCLIDFNIALVLDGADSDMLGLSHGYASPEQYGPQALPRDMQIAPNSQSVMPFRPADKSGATTEISDAATDLETDVDADAATDLEPDLAATEITGAAAGEAESVSRQSASARRRKKIRMDVRSDIYSLGATLYHLATGVKPAIATGEIAPLGSHGLPLSEAFLYIVTRCMQRDPAERFQTAADLYDAIRNIHRHDTRWKVSQAKKIAAAVILPLVFALFAASTALGTRVMAQEKEARYYDAVYDIAHGSDPQAAYELALSMFWDRIDPYRAMAVKLWDDGDVAACCAYIEANLGSIAQFQNDPESARGFGDIYFVLGNCYERSGQLDSAKSAYETAVRFVTDNAVYYRDYAIVLARTGDAALAEQVLEKARAADLDTHSLVLLAGEIALAKGEDARAIDSFEQVAGSADDAYLRYRAYHALDEIYKRIGQPERAVALLSDALGRIPLNTVREMTERLADAYVKAGDFDSAITLFEQLSQSGAPQYHIMEGLALLLQNAGRAEDAARVLDQMLEAFPQDYRVPMRQAYLEAERQSKLENEGRDYQETKLFYDRAAELYAQGLKPGQSDPEMQQLELLIAQLRENQWID